MFPHHSTQSHRETSPHHKQTSISKIQPNSSMSEDLFPWECHYNLSFEWRCMGKVLAGLCSGVFTEHTAAGQWNQVRPQPLNAQVKNRFAFNRDLVLKWFVTEGSLCSSKKKTGLDEEFRSSENVKIVFSTSNLITPLKPTKAKSLYS